MCSYCEAGIGFEKDDIVFVQHHAIGWDEDNEAHYYTGLKAGIVLEVSEKYGTVLVQWDVGIKNRNMDLEWHWPEDFVARIRDGKLEAFHHMFNPYDMSEYNQMVECPDHG